jgi:hypothetical protein
MPPLLQRFLPKTDNRVDRACAMLVLTTCGAVILATLAMILFWVFTGSLEDVSTITAGTVLLLMMLGLVALVRRGNIRLALWLVVALLGFITLEISVEYGVSTLSSAAFLIPIVLAACGAGLWAGLFLALVGSAGMWVIAFASSSGALHPYIPYQVSNLTFDAPFLTILFFLIAIIVGVWGREMAR